MQVLDGADEVHIDHIIPAHVFEIDHSVGILVNSIEEGLQFLLSFHLQSCFDLMIINIDSIDCDGTSFLIVIMLVAKVESPPLISKQI